MKRILLIDDDDLTLLFLKRILENQGYQVSAATNGESGLERFREKPFDLVITDMVMPVKDGLKTIMELRELDENVPVIAISGGGVIAKERYLAVAAYLDNVRTIAKPFGREEMYQLVRELLQEEEPGA